MGGWKIGGWLVGVEGLVDSGLKVWLDGLIG